MMVASRVSLALCALSTVLALAPTAAFSESEGVPPPAEAKVHLSPAKVKPGAAVDVLVESERAFSVAIRFTGAPGNLGTWSELDTSAPGVWPETIAAPEEPGMYPVDLKVDGVFMPHKALLRDAPPAFFTRPGHTTSAAAARNAVALLLTPGNDDTRVTAVRRRVLLSGDKRVGSLNRLYAVTFKLLQPTLVLPEGTYTYFAYVLRDGFKGPWRVLELGSGP